MTILLSGLSTLLSLYLAVVLAARRYRARKRARALDFYTDEIEGRWKALAALRQQFAGRPVLQWCAVAEAEVELLGHVRELLAAVDLYDGLQFPTAAHDAVIANILAIQLDAFANRVNTHILDGDFRLSLGYLLLKGHPNAPEVLREYIQKLKAFNKQMEPHRQALNARRDRAAHPTWGTPAPPLVDIHSLAAQMMDALLALLKLIYTVSPVRNPQPMFTANAQRRVAELDALLSQPEPDKN